jgi:lysophospholipase L1-like esterase
VTPVRLREFVCSPRGPRSRLGVVVASLGAVAALVVGCSASPPAAPARPAAPASPAAFERYVALGDSYTAGPLIPTTDVAGGCFRSDHNYPSLLAARLDVERFVDVSCAGATTADLQHPQNTVQDATVPPQLRAVDGDTDLVTIGLGGNDHALFATLVGICTSLRSTVPHGAPCAEHLAGLHPGLREITRDIADHLVEAVTAVRERAPAATVVLVGYPRLVPDHGTCRALPLAHGDYATGRRVTRQLNDAVARAARLTGALFVDMYAASRGHDICSADPWVNGRRDRRGVALGYHPLAAGMAAVADAILTVLPTR